MDTGYVHLLDASAKARVLEQRAPSAPPPAGSPAPSYAMNPVLPSTPTPWRRNATRSPVGRRARDLPVVRSGRPGRRGVVDADARSAEHADTFVAFELGTMFRPVRPDLPRRLPPDCSTSKRASAPSTRRSAASPSGHRLALRDRTPARLPRVHRQRPRHRHGDVRQRLPARPERRSPPTSSPAATRMWRPATPAFYELNDLLQYLGIFAFRARCRPTGTTRRCSCSSAVGSGHATPTPRRTGPARRRRGRPAPIVGPHRRARRGGDVSRRPHLGRSRSSRRDDLRARLARARHRRADRRRRAIGPGDPLAPAAHRLRRSEHASATASPSCRWRAGTAPPTAGRPIWSRRRWRASGASGAKLVWGGEAVAVRHDGAGQPAPARDRPRSTIADLAALRADLLDAHARAHRRDRRPAGRPAAHPLGPVRPGRPARPSRGSPTATRILDRRVGADATTPSSPTTSSTRSPADYVRRRRARADAGLRLRRREALPRLPAPRAAVGASTGPAATAATSRAARGSSRTRRRRHPRRAPRAWRSVCGSRRSTSCRSPPAPTGPACPADRATAYRYAFGGDGTGARRRPHRGARRSARSLARARHRAGLHHRRQPVLQPARAAAGLLPAVRRLPPPEDPLVGVARQLDATAELARAASRAHGRRLGVLATSRTGCPRRPSAVVADGDADVDRPRPHGAVVPRRCRPTCSPADRSTRPRICRTFSDCTTAPRNGLVSGCYPLDPAYKTHPDRPQLVMAKRRARSAGKPPGNTGVSANNPDR